MQISFFNLSLSVSHYLKKKTKQYITKQGSEQLTNLEW